MGLYKLCEHKGRARDRCAHAWWVRFRHVRVSLEKWANREIRSKTEAEAVFDDLKNAIRGGTFDKRGQDVPREPATLTVRQFAEIYKERHVFAKSSRSARRSTTACDRSSSTSATARSRRFEPAMSRTSSPTSANRMSRDEGSRRASCRQHR